LSGSDRLILLAAHQAAECVVTQITRTDLIRLSGQRIVGLRLEGLVAALVVLGAHVNEAQVGEFAYRGDVISDDRLKRVSVFNVAVRYRALLRIVIKAETLCCNKRAVG
jgi:hypothetical protein